MIKPLSTLCVSILALGLILATGCDKKEATPSKTTAEKSTKPSLSKLESRTEQGLNGTIRIADQSLRVTPFVSHDPHSDLRTNCLKAYDDAVKNKEANPILCYDKKQRPAASVLRVETYDPKGFEHARGEMAKNSEGAHFIIRSSGSIYQILDIAYSVRREGKMRPSEIRVLSAFPDKEEMLFKELKTYLPNLKMEKHDHVSDSK